MGFVVGKDLSANGLVESLIEQCKGFKSQLTLGLAVLELQQTMIDDVCNGAVCDAKTKFIYWCAVLLKLQEDGHALARAVYNGLCTILHQRGSLISVFKKNEKTWFLSLEAIFSAKPNPLYDPKFVPQVASASPQKPPSILSEISSLSSYSDDQSRLGSPHSGVSSRQGMLGHGVGSYDSTATASTWSSRGGLKRKIKTAGDELIFGETEATRTEELFLQQAKVDVFKGIYTALRADMLFKGNFLNNLGDGGSSKQVDIIENHTKAARGFLGESPSVIAWRMAQRLFNSRNLKPFSTEERLKIKGKVTAYLEIYTYLRKYQNGVSNFAAKIEKLPLVAQWAAIECHVQANVHSRSVQAWQLAQQAIEGEYSFDRSLDGSTKKWQLPENTKAWLLAQLTIVHPVASHTGASPSLGVGIQPQGNLQQVVVVNVNKYTEK